MMAFALADLREWLGRPMAKTAVKGALVLAAAGMVGPLHPVFMALAYAAACVASGWAEGYRYQSALSARRLLLVFPRSPIQVVGGKFLSLAAIWMALTFIFSPLLAASAIAWGTSPAFIAASLFVSIAAYFVSGSAGFLLCLLFDTFSGPFGLLLLCAWTIPGFFSPWVRGTNPFFQIVEFSDLNWAPYHFAGTGAEAIVAVLFFLLSVPAVARSRRRHHG